MMRLVAYFTMTFAVLAFVSDRLWAQEMESCLKCHEEGSVESRLHISGAKFRMSVHGKELSCLDCHPKANEKSHEHNKVVTPVKCGECHDEQKPVHGLGKPGSPKCYHCHGKHAILRRSDEGSTLSSSGLVQTCGQCHPEQAEQGSIVTSVLSFRIKGHAKGNLAEVYSERRCLDCHQGQAAHGENEPLSGADCRLCHNPEIPGWVFLGTFHGSVPRLRKDIRGTFGDLLYLISLGGLLGVVAWGWTRRVRFWRMGLSAPRWDHPWIRFTGWLRIVLAQQKVFARKTAGWSHILLFLGVVIPLLVIIVTQVEFTIPSLPAEILSVLLEIVGVGLLIGVLLALYRRLRHQKEFPHEEKSNLAALFLLGLIALSGLLLEGLRISTTGARSGASPVGWILAHMLPGSALGTKAIWRVHLLLVLSFLAITPFSRLRHLVTVPLNVYFRNLETGSGLQAIEVDEGELFGISSGHDMTWKGLLDTDACLSCGRCREVCPAYAAEKPLSPMKVIRDMRAHAQTCFQAAQQGPRSLLDGWITEEEIWACTTCQACQSVCPVFVEHVDKIVGLRRSLVLNDGRLPREAIALLRNLDLFGDPFGHGPAQRLDWLTNPPGPTEDTRSDVLLWVGCLGAFHPRARQIGRAVVALADRAGEKFTLLGEQECCCGDPARRLGAEDVFQQKARQNIECLRASGVRTIVAFCPHCYNTLRNEYPDLGGDFTVLSATQWALDLFARGYLTVRRSLPRKVAYHDPCYLSRINDMAEAPRRILRSIPGVELMELEKSEQDTFCCGAGGGRMWLHESGVRINQLRAGQCLDVQARQVVTACPYCVVMLEDGLTSQDEGTPIRVSDISEILEWVTR